MNLKSNHKVWLVFAQLLGMETEQERRQLDEIVVPDSKEKLLLDEMSSGEDYLRRRQMIEDIDVDRELERVMRPRRRRLSVLLGRVAAVLLPLLLGGTAIYVMYSRNNASLKNVISLHDVEGPWRLCLSRVTGHCGNYRQPGTILTKRMEVR